ncbi:hypothetical protein G9P55_28645 [Klebsiella pneumoniae]|uniref:hypothetical protein n=1 Tax=Klebsiella pneumoniae TaxID=573 RepID=UPI00148F2CC5|nr:hypothetical protein [Klebsiella pneumoniae]NOP94254.1 hypothetical protein [Klebsiella pneumoniae]
MTHHRPINGYAGAPFSMTGFLGTAVPKFQKSEFRNTHLGRMRVFNFFIKKGMRHGKQLFPEA